MDNFFEPPLIGACIFGQSGGPTAVINASQYSFIFSLAPNDMNDLVELYRKSGEINESEQNTIISAGIGNAFFISGPMNRTMVQIVANDYVKRLFGK